MMRPKPNTHYPGDCINIMRSWGEDNLFDACIADPPYGILKKGLPGGKYTTHVTSSDLSQFPDLSTYLDFTTLWIDQMVRVVKPNGNLFVWCNNSNRRYTEEQLSGKHRLKLINAIVWHKPNAQPNVTKRTLQHSHEYVLWYANGKSHWTFNYNASKALNNGKQLNDVWSFPYIHHTKRIHPNEKPLPLLHRLLIFGTNSKDLVLDPFAGSGATNEAAINTGRRFVSIEINEKLTPLIAQRMETATFDPSLLDQNQ